jgi:hypothetical protein
LGELHGDKVGELVADVLRGLTGRIENIKPEAASKLLSLAESVIEKAISA